MGGDCGQPCRELEVLARLGENKGRTEEIKELVLKLQDRLSRVSRPCELEKAQRIRPRTELIALRPSQRTFRNTTIFCPLFRIN